MSAHNVIAPQPDMAWEPNGELAIAGRHAMFCAVICACCADACAAEDRDMGRCVRTCLDCADICHATSRLAVRRTGNDAALRAVLETCISVCALCAAECERHDFPHCQLCAEMCRTMEADCQRALLALA